MKKDNKFDIVYDSASALSATIFPPLAIPFAIIKPIIKSRIGNRIEEERVTKLFETFTEHLNQKIIRKESIRDDDFIKKHGQEVTEAIIQIAKNNYEEMKSKHIAYFFVNIAFNNLDEIEFHSLLKLFENLSFYQLILLEIYFRHKEKIKITSILNNPGNYENKLYGVHIYCTREYEIFLSALKDLEDKGLLVYLDNFKKRKIDIDPNNYSLTGLGQLIYFEFNLNKIDNDEILKNLEYINNSQLEKEEYTPNRYDCLPNTFDINNGTLHQSNDQIIYQITLEEKDFSNQNVTIIPPILFEVKPIVFVSGLKRYKVNYLQDRILLSTKDKEIFMVSVILFYTRQQ